MAVAIKLFVRNELFFVLALGADKIHFLAQNGTHAVLCQIHLRDAYTEGAPYLAGSNAPQNIVVENLELPG